MKLSSTYQSNIYVQAEISYSNTSLKPGKKKTHIMHPSQILTCRANFQLTGVFRYFSISSCKLQDRICAQLKESLVSKMWCAIGTHCALNEEQFGNPNNMQNMVSSNKKGSLNHEIGYTKSEVGITNVGSSIHDFTTS